jgi:hypothetical protein
MFMSRSIWLSALALFCIPAAGAPACVLCGGGNPQTTMTIRLAAMQARFIVYGTMANPRLNPPNVGALGSGTTEFHIAQVFKSDPYLAGKKALTIPRYIPVDAKAPPRYILFCDLVNNDLDAFRGMAVNSAAAVDYVKGALALDRRNQVQILLYFFRYLDHADTDLANDAFIEFAKASDRQIGEVARRLAPERVRRLLQNPKTPGERLALYAFLLGACGGPRDADLLRSMLDKPTERTARAMDGLLSGYIQLRPRQGWDLAAAILADGRRPFLDRFAVLRTLRFYQAWDAQASRREVLRALAGALGQGDIADMAIEDLRRGQMWELTAGVLAQYGKESHAAPIVVQAIVRYALCCPRPEAAQFVARLPRDLVAEVRESLEYEKVK